ncbi:MAG TPA: formate dehydrogenase subunit gamma [Rhodopila sp.]|uniref:formate dehydrogenase subunit gamma n=1 Tax=Rhodopila sp. TaxID=2480087 RepID=UPI002CE01BAF|nr:formate dehydrogenase subunit gamma [Rhodopila sp.]HVY17019.1 formate dehydrogenase subunit gamma [Rhodopila sp.]
MAHYEPWNADRAASIIKGFGPAQGAGGDDPETSGQTLALPILHALQHTFGCVPAHAEPLIAAHLNISRADVHGIVSFYHEFRRTPPGRHTLRLCRAEACQSVGSEAVAETVHAVLGIDWHDTTANGAVTLEPVFCLGLCASGPAALLDGQPVGRLTAERACALLGDLS